MEANNIAILGGGNLDNAIAEGLLIKGLCKAGNIFITQKPADLNEMEHQGFSLSLIKGLMSYYERILTMMNKPK